MAPRDVYPVVVETRDPHLPEGHLDPVRSGFSERGRVLKASWRIKEAE